VKAVQQRYRDEVLSSIPAHITITGSGGVGVFEPEQEDKEAFAVLDAIAAETAPIRASFGKVLRFPNTDIFVFTLEDERPFFSVHARIAKSGLRFKPSPFPFKPHCTLHSRSLLSDADAAELLSLQILDEFTLDTITIHVVDEIPGKHLRQFRLRSHKE
jgi:2'-5' RNA ligase